MGIFGVFNSGVNSIKEFFTGKPAARPAGEAVKLAGGAIGGAAAKVAADSLSKGDSQVKDASNKQGSAVNNVNNFQASDKVDVAQGTIDWDKAAAADNHKTIQIPDSVKNSKDPAAVIKYLHSKVSPEDAKKLDKFMDDLSAKYLKTLSGAAKLSQKDWIRNEIIKGLQDPGITQGQLDKIIDGSFKPETYIHIRVDLGRPIG